MMTIADNAQAAQYYTVEGGSSLKVDEWGTCYNVINLSGYPTVFIPTNTSTEWSAFINHHPSHISLSSCRLPQDTTIDWYEQTGGIIHLQWLIQNLPQTVYTAANESYTISHINYRYIKSHCYRESTAGGMGDNVVAIKVKLPGDSTDYWANDIVSYSLGSDGIAESRWNALGPDDQNGPYIPQGPSGAPTYLGNKHSEIVVKFAVP